MQNDFSWLSYDYAICNKYGGLRISKSRWKCMIARSNWFLLFIAAPQCSEDDECSDATMSNCNDAGKCVGK